MDKIEELESKLKEMQEELAELKKEKKNKRWRAKDGNREYFYVSSNIEVDFNYDYDDNDDLRYKYHNYFKTEEEAQAVLDNIKTHIELMELAEELDTEPVDWSNIDQEKYYLYFDTMFNEGIVQGVNTHYKHSRDVYCTNENFKEEAIKRIGEERLIKYLKGE